MQSMQLPRNLGCTVYNFTVIHLGRSSDEMRRRATRVLSRGNLRAIVKIAVSKSI